MRELIKTLQEIQNETINIVSSVTEEDYQKQFHNDLSPIGWHLGHCIYTESYWIKEKLLSKEAINDSLKSLYIPELSKKKLRGTLIPNKSEMLEWAIKTHIENRELLETISNKHKSHQLLKNNFLYHFLIQHYSQHIETMHMVLTEMKIDYSEDKVSYPELNNLSGEKYSRQEIVTVDAGSYAIGSDKSHKTYDNEQPLNSVELEGFKIATLPVSNNNYLAFMKDEGYLKKDFWTNQGWEWSNNNNITHPHHWRLLGDSTWYGINHKGLYSLNGSDPIHGLNHFEAMAYANWAGGRLPHEYEWEVANKKKLLQKTSCVWEWCNNTFHPYPGFSHYPYEGYSVPYFDDEHYVLKGGSVYTKEFIKRPSFRNYYTTDKRHIFAGVRLVYP